MLISEKYKKLENNKSSYITRAENISALTLPKVFPAEGTNDGDLTFPNQSLGSIGVTTLVSKLMLILFPPTGISKLSIDELTISQKNSAINLAKNIYSNLEMDENLKIEYMKQLDDEIINSSSLKTALRLLEKKIDTIINKDILGKISTALMHFVVTGNFCIYIDKDFSSRLYTLRNFVSDRDREGNLIEVIAFDTINFSSLNEEQQNFYLKETGKNIEDIKDIKIYTHSKKINSKKYEIKEYLDDVEIKTFNTKNNPMIVPFTDFESGNIYNYGISNEIFSDLNSLDQLTKNTKDVSAAASRIIFLAKQGSLNMIKDLVKAKNLDFVYGDKEKISTLQVDKLNDLQIVNLEKQEITKRIYSFFLMNSAASRDGERVTKYEIQKVISDIDAAFGNLYSILSRQIQLPIVEIILEYLSGEGDLKGLVPDDLEINVISIKDKLAKEANLNNINYLIQSAGNMGVVKRLNSENILREICNTIDVSFADLIYNESQYVENLTKEQKIMLDLEMQKIELQNQLQQMQQMQQNQEQQ